jgi:anti-sigma-K factor RskA
LTCDDVREAAGAHALGALDLLEARELERHLAEAGPHQGCREAVEQARRTALALAGAVAVREVRPSPGLWEAVEARTGERMRRPSTTWRRWGAWGAAAAAAVALVVAGLLGRELQHQRSAAQASSRDRDLARAELSALQGENALQAEALALLDRPGSRVVPLEPQPGRRERAVAILDVTGGRALISSSSLPAVAGRDYQLWVIRGAGPPRPAGFLRVSGRAAAGEIDPALLRGPPPDALAVSLEPAGGSPAPTQVLMVGKVSG